MYERPDMYERADMCERPGLQLPIGGRPVVLIVSVTSAVTEL